MKASKQSLTNIKQMYTEEIMKGKKPVNASTKSVTVHHPTTSPVMKRWQHPSPGWEKLKIDGYLNTLTNIKQMYTEEILKGKKPVNAGMKSVTVHHPTTPTVMKRWQHPSPCWEKLNIDGSVKL
jgi:hypothetical protein